MKEGMTRRQWEKIEKVLDPCPFCGQRVRLVQSDGGDCRMSRECKKGYYIKCWNCDLLFGYEPDRGGAWRKEDLDALVKDWNESKARARLELKMPYQITLAAARVNAGLKQWQAGEMLGIGQDKVSQYETGRCHMPLSVLDRFAWLYGVKSEWIKEVGE